MAALVETMFYVGEEPWHHLGTKLDKPPTAADAIYAAGLDWDVQCHPVYCQQATLDLMSLPDGSIAQRTSYGDGYEQVPEARVVRRSTDGAFMGVVGPVWEPVQNRDAFNFFDPLVQQGLAIYHTAGSLRDGKQIWILAQIGEALTVIGDDKISQFLLLTMGHDGIHAVNVLPTTIRVVCANTNRAALEGADAQKVNLKITHSKRAPQRLADLSDFIAPYLVSYEATLGVFRAMAATPTSEELVDAFLQYVFPDPVRRDGTAGNGDHAGKVRDMVRDKFEGSMMGMSLIPTDQRRTAWTLYNAVTEYVDHERGKTDDSRMQSAWFGAGRQAKDRAYLMARKLARA